MLISIAGKSGSGKSTITNKLVGLNSKIRYLDIDKIGHYVNNLPEVQEKLITVFGKNIIEKDQVNRKVLGSIVFNNKEAMQTLTDITWPVMERIIDAYIKENQDKIIVLDWLLLPKTKYLAASNLKILVTAPLEIRMERVIKRDNISKEKFLEREQAAIDFDEQDFDQVIENIGNIEREVRKIYEKNIISCKF